ncbi:TetR/AcrR family transcriptional regulator [Micromonospora sp. 4G55]|uniref:TetR/AcrR family transcriptional regulator n=1 Tax=Micromonospora sp. 4G55 TaxID=2806102 RepID=UPI001A607F62|nr:TetR/AcrR family transcriptional regulator [Micromonospora sp. 4G55]MBM0256113.1 TetR/AcrR family transcriptional regulator [Micromonospora sp. 4G55]MBM0256288.1 TetR/AcrR family transcriptional regulator [Micromonospora sp. 4G55]
MASTRRPAPREQLLATASRLFYNDGINSVGVDRVLQEAGVTRATLYRHFAGKEALVVAYLEREDQMIRALWDEGLGRAVSADHALEMAIEGVADDAYRHHTRGCPFIKAAGEFPDPESPVRQVISKHRAWFHAELRRLLTEAGRDDVDAKAETLAMLRDALMVGCFLDDPDATRRTFVRNARWVAGLR